MTARARRAEDPVQDPRRGSAGLPACEGRAEYVAAEGSIVRSKVTWREEPRE